MHSVFVTEAGRLGPWLVRVGGKVAVVSLWWTRPVGRTVSRLTSLLALSRLEPGRDLL